MTASSRRWLGTRSRSRQLFDQRHACVLVSMVRGQLVRGRRRALPRSCISTAKRTATPPPSFTASRRAMQLVYAGVDFRMPFLGLRHAEQRVEFRVDHLERATVTQHADEHVGARLAQRLFGLRPDALGHQRVRLAGLDHAAA